MQSAVRLTLRNLAPSAPLMELIRGHLGCLEPYEDHFVRCHLELAQVDAGYHAHVQLILVRGDVVRIHAEEDEPGHPTPKAAMTTSLARALAQLARARSTLPPDPRLGSHAWRI